MDKRHVLELKDRKKIHKKINQILISQRRQSTFCVIPCVIYFLYFFL